jgi:putative ABC transport system permease protein
MNLLQLVFKQMRQRALSSWLTTLSVLLGVALWVAIAILNREGDKLFGQRDYGYDLLIGAKGSPLQLVMNTVYNIDKSPGNIPYDLYEKMLGREAPLNQYVRLAVPFAVGDTFKGHRIIATSTKMFGITEDGRPMTQPFRYRYGKTFSLQSGRVFHPQKLEAVIGSDVAGRTGLKIGDHFHATHGGTEGTAHPDEHVDVEWEVVGILAPTHTAADKALYIPLITFYCIEAHEQALDMMAKVKSGQSAAEAASPHHDHDHEEPPFKKNPDGMIEITTPKSEWKISGIYANGRSFAGGQQLAFELNNGDIAQAVIPADVMRQFFDTFLAPFGSVLQVVSILVLVVASVSILVSIYNSISARLKEIAILRALGATQGKILSMICTEAAVIGLLGAVLGLALGHGIAAAGSIYTQRVMGESLNWTTVSAIEWAYAGCVVILAAVAGLVPALKAYSAPVATNLVAT